MKKPLLHFKFKFEVKFKVDGQIRTSGEGTAKAPSFAQAWDAAAKCVAEDFGIEDTSVIITSMIEYIPRKKRSKS